MQSTKQMPCLSCGKGVCASACPSHSAILSKVQKDASYGYKIFPVSSLKD